MKIPKPLFLVILVLLNALPVYGVLLWGWKSFDLIFLYWMENLFIGVFMIIRMVVRPYSHAVELFMPLFLVPFFTFHYGMFCFVHGQIVVSMFGKNLDPQLAGMSLQQLIIPLIESRHLFWPLMGLLSYQLFDWIREVSLRGLGSDGVMALTTAPYRRIVVLHITIIGSGFAMGVLNEPLAGLILLIIFKTGMDIYNWNKDKHKGTEKANFVIGENIKQKVDAFLDNPVININGKETHYKNYEDLKNSPQYGMIMGVLRMMGGGQQVKAIENYIEQQEKARGIRSG